MIEDRIYTQIREKLGNDLTPVTPLKNAWKRAIWAIPVCCLFITITLLLFKLRDDYSNFHPVEIWGFILLQSLICFLIMTAVLKSGVPGSFPNFLYLVFPAFTGTVIYLAFTFLHFNTSPNHPDPGMELKTGIACISIIGGYGLFALLAGYILARSGLPFRAETVGLLSGLGNGLMAEAAWRLHCPYTSWDHVLIYHGTPILILLAAGLGLGRLWKFRSNIRQ